MRQPGERVADAAWDHLDRETRVGLDGAPDQIIASAKTSLIGG